MDKSSLKTVAELFRLASQFFEEAAELVAGQVRREEILGRDMKSKAVKIEEVEKRDKKVEKIEKKEEVKEKPVEHPVKPKDSKKKKVEKKKNGYFLFLSDKSKDLKKNPDFKNYSVTDFSKMIKGLWDKLDSSEREIWEEKSLEAGKNNKVVEIMPQKHFRAEDGKKKEGDDEGDGESLKKKKKSS